MSDLFQNEYAASEKLLIYQKHFSRDYVCRLVTSGKIDGIWIFDHFDPLESLDFLSDWTFLKKLDVSAIRDHDYGFLRNLQGLKWLAVKICVGNKNPIDLRPLNQLEYLSVEVRKRKLIGLETCFSLRSLILHNYKIKDLHTISSLSGLERLWVYSTPLHALDGIDNLTNLRELRLVLCTKLESIEKLSALHGLQSLEFWNCGSIGDFSIVGKLPYLTKLSLDNCKSIKSIGFIKSLPNLNNLLVSGNSVIVDNDLTPAATIANPRILHRRSYNTRIPW